MIAAAHRFVRRRSGRSGQVAIFLLMAFLALAFLVLWNADLHRIVTLKTRSQNAGDAAALAAARWQASTLNLIGELNLMHALALSAGNAQAVDALTNIQARLCYAGPMAGVVAAQQAAKQNGIHANPDFNDDFLAYRNEVAADTTFPALYGDGTEARDDYLEMLDAVLADGIAAEPPYNTEPVAYHILRDPAFYEAVAGRNWCWFFIHHPNLLEEYTDHSWWPPLPPPPTIHELYSVRVRPVSASLTELVDLAPLRARAAEADIDLAPVASNRVTAVQTWYCYAAGWWGAWDKMRTDGEDPFPIVGPVKAEYDYAGADASAKVEADAQRLTPGLDGTGSTRRDFIGWTAAAKAFGYLGDEANRETPSAYGLVMPAFRDVRLIPLDASSAPEGDSSNADWGPHFAFGDRGHLQRYVDTGEYRTGCWYCRLLQRWDDPAFRQEGREWLEQYSDRCTLPPPGRGGGGRGGGTRRGH